MTDQDKENIRNFCHNLAENWIKRNYDRTFLIIGIDKRGNLKSFEMKKSLMEEIKKEKFESE